MGKNDFMILLLRPPVSKSYRGQRHESLDGGGYKQKKPLLPNNRDQINDDDDDARGIFVSWEL